MSDEFRTIAGIIQFDPNEREYNNQTLQDCVVKALGSQLLVKITLWPEVGDLTVAKGDFIVADGKYNEVVKDGKSYHNLSAKTVVHVPSVPRREPDTSGTPSSGTRNRTPAF